MFDTSVYGNLVEDDIIRDKFENKFESGEYVVYGNSIIRKELRSTPKKTQFLNCIRHLKKNYCEVLPL